MTGAGKLVRLILRRDRLLLPIWIVVLPLVVLNLLASFRKLYPNAAALQQYYDISAHNATFAALYGRLWGATLGAMLAWRAGFVPVVVGLIAILIVIRHTRTEEEAGRRELVGATVVGRHAGLAAALAVALAANLVLALLVALLLAGQGLPGAGSLAFGLELAAAGWAFAAVGAVAAQLTTGAGAARGIAVGTLGAAYTLGVVGDVSDRLSWVGWLSPIGWVHRIHPYGDTQWWILGLVVAFTAVLSAGAVALSARRDVGAGLLPTRLGRAVAAAGLRSPLALAWRLHRGLLAGWVAGFAVLGLVLGSIAQSIGDMLNENPNLQEIFARIGGRAGLIDAYLAGIMNLLGLIAAGYAIQAALRLRAEEASGHAEPLLATAVGRIRWALSHLTFSVLGPAAALAAAGLTAGLAHGLNTGHPGHDLPRVLAAALVQLPAVWVLGAVAAALTGAVPRLATLAWGALAACLLISLIGAALQLNQRLLDLSPFTHIPRVPGATLSAMPLVWLVAVAVALGALGLVALRRRDIPVT
jgi:polyether ionophore transport system permease protein